MDFRQFAMKKLTLFFMLTTLITAAVYIIGSIFDAKARFGYSELLTPIRLAACCVLPSFVTYSRRELKPRKLALRIVLQFLLTEAVILSLLFGAKVFDSTNLTAVLTVALSVLIIFALVWLFSWLRDSAEAKRLNHELARFRQQFGEDEEE